MISERRRLWRSRHGGFGRLAFRDTKSVVQGRTAVRSPARDWMEMEAGARLTA